jgi:hypothetical protein
MLRTKGKYNTDGLSKKNILSGLKKFKQNLKKIFPQRQFSKLSEPRENKIFFPKYYSPLLQNKNWGTEFPRKQNWSIEITNKLYVSVKIILLCVI